MSQSLWNITSTWFLTAGTDMTAEKFTLIPVDSRYFLQGAQVDKKT